MQKCQLVRQDRYAKPRMLFSLTRKLRETRGLGCLRKLETVVKDLDCCAMETVGDSAIKGVMSLQRRLDV